ncbi:MAG: late competence development ComFB family protein [Alkalinema sp. CAN_BIN05]|nr:late competence development ComFB family protein [Alkalinema sp. CAN_BIN05]
MNTLINQTQSIIQREINEVLETYPHHPYQQIFAHPDHRQELVAYVLNHVPSIYTSVDITSHEFTLASPTAILVNVETTIHRGISQLLRGQSLEHEVPSISDPSLMASNWFG